MSSYSGSERYPHNIGAAVVGTPIEHSQPYDTIIEALWGLECAKKNNGAAMEDDRVYS